MKVKYIKLINVWEDDVVPQTYYTVEIDKGYKVDICYKHKTECQDEFMYIMNTGNGMEIYLNVDDGVDMLDDEDYDNIIEFISKEVRGNKNDNMFLRLKEEENK